MICQLDRTNVEIAQKMLDIQIPAYKVEAEIINFDGIPQLKDTVDTIMKSDELFVGYWLEGILAGFISYTMDQKHCDICRLVVEPTHFRKGIARSLVEHLLSSVEVGSFITVSTGAKNTPATTLYTRLGFHEEKNLEVAPHIFITQFSKFK